MSLSALLIATRDQIRHSLSLRESDCLVMPDGQPLPLCGEQFIAVHGAAWGPGPSPQESAVDEYFGVECTITRRIGHAARDRLSDEFFLRASQGIEATARKLIAALLKNRYTVMENANKLIPHEYGFVEPFRWSGCDPTPRVVGPEWFFSSEPEGPTGLVFTVRFDNARRVQPFSKMG
ncbi:MAG: hypothetical protein JRI66_09180 [Deltaproteobacteria bacterium]|nr:hypothetical protein [Deltaproteobacteria bacterium]